MCGGQLDSALLISGVSDGNENFFKRYQRRTRVQSTGMIPVVSGVGGGGNLLAPRTGSATDPRLE